MRVRIFKKEINIPWEYFVAVVLIIIAAVIVLAYRMDSERGEVVPVDAPSMKSPAVKPSEPAGTDGSQDYYDVPDADDNESGADWSGGSAVLSVNINNAGMDELISLPYIGEVKARAIIEYRTRNGPFESVEDLLNVKGIGPKTLERLRPFITLRQ